MNDFQFDHALNAGIAMTLILVNRFVINHSRSLK